MKLGCHTLQWGMGIDKKRRYTWDGTERDLSLPQVLADISKLKFAGFECTDNDVGVYRPDVKGFKKAVSDSGLEFVSTWSTIFPKKLPKSFRSVVSDKSLPMSDPSQYLAISIKRMDPAKAKSEIKNQVEYAKFVTRLGAKLLTVGGPYIAQENIKESYYPILGEVLNGLGEKAQKLGMKIAYHPEVGTMARSSEEVDHLFDHADKKLVNLCLETAHLTAMGDDPVKFVDKYTSRIVHVHFKDLAKGTFAELGTGVVDFPGIVRALKSFGYKGWIMAELDFPPGEPFDSAVRNKAYLDKLVK
jgi:sugar phosphate isomerase/epimerase